MFDILILLASYLLGSVSGSLLLGRFRGVDIRNQGSGNAGGTNAFRTQGFKFALGVVLIDIGKGALAAYLALRFSSPAYRDVLPSAAVFCAVIGHVWPVFHGFRGGKGAATLVGGLLLLFPAAVLILVAVWCLCLSLTGYVGLSTVLAGFSLLAFALISDAPMPILIFSALAAFLMLFTHRANMQRLLQKNEYRFDKIMLWRRAWRALSGSRRD
ncbi:MAG TPA: glycerol-3-phosphate 1-O-acyltransferase PlsY [Arenimonas sp.]|nr:glycerol-3-phosphate 1-O-acyltransferase PlsY [Arenimonas sp.]